MIRRPPRSTLDRSSAASDVYKRQDLKKLAQEKLAWLDGLMEGKEFVCGSRFTLADVLLSLIHISEPTRPY